MVLFPKQGGIYWHVVDIWEKHVAVPAMVEYVAGRFPLMRKLFNVRIFIYECEVDTQKVTRCELYKTKKVADRKAVALNKAAAA